MPRKLKGLRRHGAGHQTYVRVNGEFRCASWPADTPISEMTDWLRKARAEKDVGAVAVRGVFEHDATLYLSKVTALPSYQDRVRDITVWARLFQGRRRRTITSAEIRGHRDRWLTEGYAGSTVNHRLRALSNLWTVLDGRRAPNPVREVDEAYEPEGEPRAVSFTLLRQILAALPDVGVAAKGARRPAVSKTKARLAVMMWIGLTHGEIARLRRRDWDDAHGVLFVQGRRKGQGGASRTIPLSAEGTAALEVFDDADAWGPFERSAFHASFRRACAVVTASTTSAHLLAQLAELRPYDVRHSHATAIYRASGDEAAAADLLGHRDRRTTKRYVQAALAERVSKAVASFAQATAPVAQRIEHRPSKARAAGSSPAGRTISRPKVASRSRQSAKLRRKSA